MTVNKQRIHWKDAITTKNFLCNLVCDFSKSLSIKNNLFYFLFLIAFIFLSCTKEGPVSASERPDSIQGPRFAWSGSSREIDNDKIYFKELNISRAETNVLWNVVEKTKGNFDFSEIRSVIDTLKVYGINDISLAVFPENALYNDVQITHKTVPQNQDQWNAYKNFLIALVTVFKNDVEYYQIIREINPARYLGTAEEYAEFLAFSSDILKDLQPDAQIVFGAMAYELRKNFSNGYFLSEVIRCLPIDKKYFDAIDIHLHRLSEEDGGPLFLENSIEHVTLVFNFYYNQIVGTSYENNQVFFETSSYTAEEGELINFPPQTENDQAQDLQQRFNVLSEKNIRWIFLEGGIFQRKYYLFGPGGDILNSRSSLPDCTEQFLKAHRRDPQYAGIIKTYSKQHAPNPLEYFEHTGLIWNPVINIGKSGKKLSFNTVKDWNKD